MPPAKHGNKRNRTSQACDRCHERKVRCNADRPRCDQCWRSGLTCSYGERRDLSHKPKKLDTNARLQRLEKLVHEMMQKDDGPAPHVDDNPLEENWLIEAESNRGPTIEKQQACDVRTFEVGYLEDPERNTGPAVYSHSILANLTTMPNLQLIGDKIGQPEMAQEVMMAIRQAQKIHEDQKMALFMQHDAAASELDIELALHCKREFRRLGYDVIFAILTPEECDRAFEDKRGLSVIVKHSVVLLVICQMLFLGETSVFSDEFLKQQQVIAFMIATRYWSFSGLLPHNETLFRSLVLYAVVTLLFTPLSQDVRALAVAHSAGQQLGLNDPRFVANSECARSRDALVWCILQEIDSIMSLSASEPPGLRVYEISPILLKTYGSVNSDLQILVHQSKLCRIHRKCYETVFSGRVLEKPHRVIFEDILRLDAELESWKSQLPLGLAHATERGEYILGSSPSVPLSRVASFFMLQLHMFFFALKAQLHALPALANSFLKDVDDEILLTKATASSSIASDAARNILRLSLSPRKIFSFCESPLYQFCLITAHEMLFFHTLMIPFDTHFEGDIDLIFASSATIRNYSTRFDGVLIAQTEILSRFREKLRCHSGVLPIASERLSSDSLMSDGQARFDFVPWVDLEASVYDQSSIESCVIV